MDMYHEAESVVDEGGGWRMVLSETKSRAATGNVPCEVERVS